MHHRQQWVHRAVDTIAMKWKMTCGRSMDRRKTERPDIVSNKSIFSTLWNSQTLRRSNMYVQRILLSEHAINSKQNLPAGISVLVKDHRATINSKHPAGQGKQRSHSLHLHWRAGWSMQSPLQKGCWKAIVSDVKAEQRRSTRRIFQG